MSTATPTREFHCSVIAKYEPAVTKDQFERIVDHLAEDFPAYHVEAFNADLAAHEVEFEVWVTAQSKDDALTAAEIEIKEGLMECLYRIAPTPTTRQWLVSTLGKASAHNAQELSPGLELSRGLTD